MKKTLLMRLSKDADFMLDDLFDLVSKVEIPSEDKIVTIQVQGTIIYDFSKDVQENVIVMLHEKE